MLIVKSIIVQKGLLDLVEKKNNQMIFETFSSLHLYLIQAFVTSNKDICLLLEKFVIVTQLMIFPFWAAWVAEKPMAGPSSSKGKNHELR